MNLYIMTRGRVGKQTTLKWIPEQWFSRTILVCSGAEVNQHVVPRGVRVWGAPPEVTNYSQKFQWILDSYPINDDRDKAVIMDDDLVFSRKIGSKLITERDPKELIPMFEQMEELLDEYPLVGIHPRQQGQNARRPHVLNQRIICIQGINRIKIGHVKVDQFPILADVILACTLLARGQSSALITTFFQDHGPCQAPGGCSIYRTSDMQHRAVQYLANRFSGFVKVVERRPKVAKWMGDTRYDYTAQWKRLYAAGVAHLLDPRTTPNPDKEAIV